MSYCPLLVCQVVHIVFFSIHHWPELYNLLCNSLEYSVKTMVYVSWHKLAFKVYPMRLKVHHV